MLDHAFDQEAGLAVVERPGLNLVLYRADRMVAVEDYIQRNIDERFTMKRDRVNTDPAYLRFKTTFKPTASDLARLYDDPWCRHFYTGREIEAFLAAT